MVALVSGVSGMMTYVRQGVDRNLLDTKQDTGKDKLN